MRQACLYHPPDDERETHETRRADAQRGGRGAGWRRLRELCADVLAIDPDNADAPALLRIADRRDGAPPVPIVESGSAPAAEDVTSAAEPPPAATETPADPPPMAPVAAAARDEPTSFVNGRYTVERFLGEGGKKKVYLTHGTTLDRMVDEIVAYGSDERVAQRINDAFDLGASEVLVSILVPGSEPEKVWDRTVGLLGELSPERGYRRR